MAGLFNRIMQGVERVEAHRERGAFKEFVKANPDFATDPEKVGQAIAIAPELGMAMLDRSERMQGLLQQRATERALYLQSELDGPQEAYEKAVEAGDGWESAAEAANDLWQGSRIAAKDRFGPSFADSLPPVWTPELYQQEAPRVNRLLDALREPYTVQVGEQAPTTMTLLPTEVAQLTGKKGKGVLVQKIGTASTSGGADPNLQRIQGNLTRVVSGARTLPERIAAVQAAQGEALQLGTSAGRGAAQTYGQEIASLRSQMVDERKDLYARTARELGLDPNNPSSTPRIADAVAARERTQAAAQARAVTEATLSAREQERVPAELARELGVPVGSTYASVADRELSRVKMEPTAAERAQGATASAVRSLAEELGRLYTPDYVGPAAGRDLALKATLGFSPATLSRITPDEARFWAQSKTLQNRIIQLVTGAQMSEAEAKRITGQIPMPNDPPTVWEAKLAQTLTNVRAMEAIMAGNTGAASGTPLAGGASPPGDAGRSGDVKQRYGLE